MNCFEVSSIPVQLVNCYSCKAVSFILPPAIHLVDFDANGSTATNLVWCILALGSFALVSSHTKGTDSPFVIEAFYQSLVTR